MKRRSDTIFLLWLLVVPFTLAPYIGDNILGIPGAKIFNILSVVMLVSVLTEGRAFQTRIEKNALKIFLIYVALFVVEVFRALPNVGNLTLLMGADENPGAVSFLLSYLVRPLFQALAFVVVIERIRSVDDVLLIARVIGYSILVYICVTLFAIIMHPWVLTDPSRQGIGQLCFSYLGMQFDLLGTVLGTVCPLMLYLAMHKGGVWIVNFALLLLVILLLQSRGSLLYVCTICAIYLVLTGHARTLLIGGTIAALVSIVVMPPSIKALLTLGVGSGGEIDVNEVSSGRVSGFWAPLIAEWLSNWNLALFGAGRYGIFSSSLWSTGAIYQAMHAHNAFIDLFLDAGLIVLTVVIGAIVGFARWVWSAGRRLNDPLYWALALSVLGYVIPAMTAGSIFPWLDNMEIYLLLGLLIGYTSLRLNNRPVCPGYTIEGCAYAKSANSIIERQAIPPP